MKQRGIILSMDLLLATLTILALSIFIAFFSATTPFDDSNSSWRHAKIALESETLVLSGMPPTLTAPTAENFACYGAPTYLAATAASDRHVQCGEWP